MISRTSRAPDAASNSGGYFRWCLGFERYIYLASLANDELCGRSLFGLFPERASFHSFLAETTAFDYVVSHFFEETKPSLSFRRKVGAAPYRAALKLARLRKPAFRKWGKKMSLMCKEDFAHCGCLESALLMTCVCACVCALLCACALYFSAARCTYIYILEALSALCVCFVAQAVWWRPSSRTR